MLLGQLLHALLFFDHEPTPPPLGPGLFIMIDGLQRTASHRAKIEVEFPMFARAILFHQSAVDYSTLSEVVHVWLQIEASALYCAAVSILHWSQP